VYGKMKICGLLRADINPAISDLARVAADPDSYVWQAWAISADTSCGGRFADTKFGHVVHVTGEYMLSWESNSKSVEGRKATPRVENRTIFPAQQTYDLIMRVRGAIEGKKDVDVNGYLDRWFASQTVLPALQDLKIKYDRHYRRSLSSTGTFTPHNTRMLYVSKLLEDVEERWFCDEASKLLGHAGISGNGRNYSWIKHVPTPVEEDTENESPNKKAKTA
jgi:hypothetical protein